MHCHFLLEICTGVSAATHYTPNAITPKTTTTM